jgi:crossover junction endodeoxyribonuclease RuvC
MIILGIDPGTATTGYGVVSVKSLKSKTKNNFKCLAYGAITTSPELSAPYRLRKIHEDLNKLLEIYQPEVLAVENIYFFRNLKTAMPVSQAKGVILLTAAKRNIPIKEFTPMQVKMMMTGSGKAEKIHVQNKVKSFLDLKEIPRPDDAADALAIAITYVLGRKSLTDDIKNI